MPNSHYYETRLASASPALSRAHLLFAWTFALLSGVATVAVFLRHLRWEGGF